MTTRSLLNKRAVFGAEVLALLAPFKDSYERNALPKDQRIAYEILEGIPKHKRLGFPAHLYFQEIKTLEKAREELPFGI